jgi:hypothetical protein
MTNRDLCIALINDFEEEKLANIAKMLQSIKEMLDESLDDAYCLKLYEDYLNDPDPEKQDAISLQDYTKELGAISQRHMIF